MYAQTVMLQSLLREFYDRTSCPERVDRIQLKDFVNVKKPHSEYPCYTTGNMSKCRRLIHFGLELATFFNSGGQHDLHRIEALKMLDSLYTQMYRGPDFFSVAQSRQFIKTVDAFLAHQNWLHEDGVTRHIKVYHRTIKSHMLWHMARDSKWYNPKLGWTYSDEDFMGKVAVLCRSVSRSVPNVDRPRKLLEKWLLALSVQWSSPP